MRTKKGDPGASGFYVLGFDSSESTDGSWVRNPSCHCQEQLWLVSGCPLGWCWACEWASLATRMYGADVPWFSRTPCLQLALPIGTLGGKKRHLHFTDVARELSGSWGDNYKFQGFKRSWWVISPKNRKCVVRHIWVFQPARGLSEGNAKAVADCCLFLWDREDTSRCL